MAQPTAKRSKMSADENACVNTVRVLSAEMVQAANSGHPGAPMGCAPMAHTLFGKVMKFNPSNPNWANRDRFVLSNGHSCALLYSMLHLTGYPGMTTEELSRFRQMGSQTPGHPENFLTPGVEVSTGPLGQGISNAVGLAIAEAHLAATFNKDGHEVIDHHTFVICGDGCLQEGVSCEASSLAGHLRLGKIVVLYDANNIQIDGSTDLAFTEDVLARYAAYGWHTSAVEDGDSDYAGLLAAVEAAKADPRPSIIKVTTTIGFGSGKAGSHKVHGAPLGAEDLAATKERLGMPGEPFAVADDVRAFYDKTEAGAALEAEWDARFAAYAAAFPAEAAELRRRLAGELPEGWEAALPTYTPADKAVATRKSSQIALNAIAPLLPELVGGSADLTPSNLTALDCSGDFQADTPAGRYLRFGVREHAMVAVCNGMAAHGGVAPYCATFLTFAGYAVGAMRVTALSRLPVLFVFTHSSISLGEDGPTHQPIESLAMLRATPNIYVVRPADANEVSAAYALALRKRTAPTAVALSRQGLPNLAGSSVEAALRGAYVLQQTNADAQPDVVLASTGGEVSLCVAAAEQLAAAGTNVRVVSMPCWEAFEEQDAAYRASVLAAGVPTLAVEAASEAGWRKYAHATLCMTSFGASAPGAQVQEAFGFSPANIAAQATAMLQHYEGKPVPDLLDVFTVPPVVLGH